MYQQHGMHGLFDSIISLGTSVVKSVPSVITAIAPIATAYIGGQAQVSAARAGLILPSAGSSGGYPPSSQLPAGYPTQYPQPYPQQAYIPQPLPQWLPYAALGGVALIVLLTQKK